MSTAKECLKDDITITGIRADEQAEEGKDLYQLEANKCVFHRCTFESCIVEKASFYDCIFQNCNLSNNSFKDAYFKHCLFQSCKSMAFAFMVLC